MKRPFSLHSSSSSIFARQWPLRPLSYVPWSFVAVSLVVGCSSNEPAPVTLGTGGTTSGGASASGGSNTGGIPTSGGAGSGGTASGGAVPGTGGSASGGAGNAGGTGGETGGDTGVGGAETGSGGMATGGAGSGGESGGDTSVCPDDLGNAIPLLDGKTPTLIPDVPAPANGGFLEGPVWYGDKLYLSQIEFGTMPESGDILTYTPGVGFAPFVEGVGTNGMAVDAAGRLIAASQQAMGVIAFDSQDSTAPPSDVARMFDGKVFNSPNDVTVRSDKTVYFTDPKNNCGGSCAQEAQGVYRVAPGGQPELLTTTQTSPNGIALSPDGTVLYVGGSALTSHPVMPDGSVGAGTPFGDLTSNTDGLGVDCAGNVYVALYSTHQVVMFSPSGERLPGSASIQEVTNIAFGGPDRKTMYITAFGDNKGRLYTIDMEIPGLPF